MSDLIDRQAAIDVLNKLADIKYTQMPYYGYYLGALHDAANDIKALPSVQPDMSGYSDRLWKLAYERGKRDAQQEWIPVTERLPEEDNFTGNGIQYSDDILMTVVNAEDEETIIDYGHTVDGEWYSDTTGCFIPNHWKVTAWMPLPEPYKGEK